MCSFNPWPATADDDRSIVRTILRVSSRTAHDKERNGLRQIVSQVPADLSVSRFCLTSDTLRVQIQVALIEQLKVVGGAQSKFLDQVSCLDGDDPFVRGLRRSRRILRRRLHGCANGQQEAERERDRSAACAWRAGSGV